MNRVVTVIVVLAVVAIGVVAAIDGFGNDSTAAGERPSREESGSRDLVGPHSPEPGALPGTLVVARGEACVVQLVDLTRLRFSKAGPDSGCDFVVSPDGALAAVAAEGESPEAVERRFELVELGGRPDTSAGIGRLAGDPVFSPDGATLAACDANGSGSTTVAPLDGSARRTVAGCWPAFADDGSIVTRTAVDLTEQLHTDGIFVDGEEAITLPELLDIAEDAVEIQGFVLGHTTAPGGLIAVSLVHPVTGGDARGSLQLWGDGVPRVTTIPLLIDERGISEEVTTEALRDRLKLGPGERELAIVLDDGAGELLVVNLESGAVLGPLAQNAFDWSPDGRWLAVATATGIDVYGPARDDEPTFQLPLVTPALAWR